MSRAAQRGSGAGWRQGHSSESAFARGVSQHTGCYWATYLGWLRQGDRIVGEEDGDIVLCKCVELLCESGTRKPCCGLTKVRITHRNNAY